MQPFFEKTSPSFFRPLGLGTLPATIIAVTFLLITAPKTTINAVEHGAKTLDPIATYSYQHEVITVSRKGKGRTVQQTFDGRWRSSPVGLRATTRIVETLNTNLLKSDKPNVIVDLVETHQAGSRGIIVDRLKKEYSWINDQLDANSIGNPLRAIYMVRQRRGRIVSNLGEKKIGKQDAKGFEIVLDNKADSDLGKATTNEDWDWKDIKITVWVDTKTDLPIEFHFSRTGENFETTYQFTDLKWNPKFSDEAFQPTAPGSDYTELVK